MRHRPTLDRLEALFDLHDGQHVDCHACELAGEVVALLRLVRFISESIEERAKLDDEADVTVDLRSVRDPAAWHAFIATQEPAIREMATSEEAAQILLRRLRGRLL